jgi:hypothetical protein
MRRPFSFLERSRVIGDMINQLVADRNDKRVSGRRWITPRGKYLRKMAT